MEDSFYGRQIRNSSLKHVVTVVKLADNAVFYDIQCLLVQSSQDKFQLKFGARKNFASPSNLICFLFEYKRTCVCNMKLNLI